MFFKTTQTSTRYLSMIINFRKCNLEKHFPSKKNIFALTKTKYNDRITFLQVRSSAIIPLT